VANNSTKKDKKNSTVSSSNEGNKERTAIEIKNWYNSQENITMFEKIRERLQLLNPSSTVTHTFTTFSKETLRQYMQNPLQNAKNLRNLSRYLYYRSQVYKRVINYNAGMINLNYRIITPLVNLTEKLDKEQLIKDYYETILTISNMNLSLEFFKIYVTCFREDVFYGCVYYDDTGFFILPLDPDYCKITSIYRTGDLGFDMDMSYFSQRQETLELWGEPFTSMYRAYESDTINGRYQPMPDENCVCLKVNIDDWQNPLPPYMGLFDSLINLEDLKEITAIADEQQIYKLIVATIPLIKGSNGVNDFAVDVDTAIDFYDKMFGDTETMPPYTHTALLPGLDIKDISFTHDQATDVNKVENTTKAVLNTSGGAQVLNSSSITGTTAWTGAIKADEDFALSSLLPQTQAWLNRFLSLKLSNPAKVRFLETTTYTVDNFKNSLRQDATYTMPVKIALNSLNGISELETLSMAHLEKALDLSNLFTPLKSSNTMNTGDLTGRPTSEESGNPLTDAGESSREKRDKSNG